MSKIRTTASNASLLFIPFHIIKKTPGSFTDEMTESIFDTRPTRPDLQDMPGSSAPSAFGWAWRFCKPAPGEKTDFEQLHELLNKKGELVDISDSTKYYDYIPSHWNNNNSYLKIYKIKYGSLKGNTANDNENFQKKFLNDPLPYIISQENRDNKLQIKIENIYFIINESAFLAYMVIDNRLNSLNELSVPEILSNLDFFRSIGITKRTEQKNRQLNNRTIFRTIINQDGINEEKPVGTFYDMLNWYFIELSDFLRISQERPSILHLDASNTVSNWGRELNTHLFKILRIPARGIEGYGIDEVEVTLKKSGPHILMAGFKEGCIICEELNENSDISSIVKKYLPAFILVLNQREILLKTMNFVSWLPSNEISDYTKEHLDKLVFLKKYLLKIQLKQVFYSVSNIKEVEDFFRLTQEVNLIDTMLKDNENSLREIHGLLETEKNKEDFKRSEKVNLLLSVFALLSVFNIIQEAIPNLIDPEVSLIFKIIPFVLTLIAGVILFRINLKKNKR
jgi:hypothetical protein